MKKINLNDLAKEVTLMEGGKVNLPIGQVKEVMKYTFTILSQDYKASEVMEAIERYENA